MIIEPIDIEINQRLLNKSYDPNYFSGKELYQYYQIADFKDLSEEKFESSIREFVKQMYDFKKLNGFSEITIHFYIKGMFNDYSDKLYESARDNINGNIIDNQDKLISMIMYKKLSKQDDNIQWEEIYYRYDNENIVIEKTDTLTVP